MREQTFVERLLGGERRRAPYQRGRGVAGKLENLGKYWKIMENLGESWRILENLGKSWKILENLGESWRILELPVYSTSQHRMHRNNGREMGPFKEAISGICTL